MKIDATTYQKLPEHLKALFQQAPNPSREEVLAGFPIVKSGAHKPGIRKMNHDPKATPASFVNGLTHRDYGAGLPASIGSAARFFQQVKRDSEDVATAQRLFYCTKASRKDRGEGNNHPTVKPTDLMRYLLRLVTPPNGVALDPFMGSGSTGKAAILEGFGFIGIEREAEYIAIARARIAHAATPLFI